MIKVYVREVSDCEGHLLGEFEPEMLPELKKSLWINDIYMQDSDNMYVSPSVIGHYVYSEKTGIYFEFVIEDKDE